jgi:hypothetical protein
VTTDPALITLDEAAAEAGWPPHLLHQLATRPWQQSHNPGNGGQPRPDVIPPVVLDRQGKAAFNRRLWERIAYHEGRPVVTVAVIAAAKQIREQSVRGALNTGRLPAPSARRPLPTVGAGLALPDQPVWWVDDVAGWLPGFGVREVRAA